MNLLSRLFLLFCILVFAVSPSFAQISDPAKFGRLHPPGDLFQHIPYQSANIYYYDRPYNAGYAEQRGLEAGPNSNINPRQPYSNQMFEQIFDEFERTAVIGQLGERTGESPIDGFHESVSQDKYLEYTDWQRHQLARWKWHHDKLQDDERALQGQSGEQMQNIQFQPMPSDSSPAEPMPYQSPIPENDNGFQRKSSQVMPTESGEYVEAMLEQRWQTIQQQPGQRRSTSVMRRTNDRLENLAIVGPSLADASPLQSGYQSRTSEVSLLDQPIGLSSMPIERTPRPIENLQIVGPSPDEPPSEAIPQLVEPIKKSAPAKRSHRQASNSLLQRIYEPKTFRPHQRN